MTLSDASHDDTPLITGAVRAVRRVTRLYMPSAAGEGVVASVPLRSMRRSRYLRVGHLGTVLLPVLNVVAVRHSHSGRSITAFGHVGGSRFFGGVASFRR